MELDFKFDIPIIFSNLSETTQKVLENYCLLLLHSPYRLLELMGENDPIKFKLLIQKLDIDLKKLIMEEKSFNEEQSSNIRHIKYDKQRQVMTVQFRSSIKQYEYSDVPENVWNEALNSASIGKFIAGTIKPNYPCKPQ